MNIVTLSRAVLCEECHCISESRTEVCPACGTRSLTLLQPLLDRNVHAVTVNGTIAYMERSL